MIDHRRGDNYFMKLDFANSHLAPEFRCYYDQNNDDYIISKASLFYLLQRLSPNTGISRQIAMQSQLASGQFEDLSKMVSLKELTKSSIFLSEDLERIKENLLPDQYSGFKVSQNGEIILTKKMLLEALQQISKSRDEKFFSEQFSYIAKDFDPSQPSQYSAQSFEEYKDWLVGLNKDRILQINIEQLKIDCQNGRAGERINLQNFLAKSELESDLLIDINNYFRKIFASNLKENQKTNYFMHTPSQSPINPNPTLDKAKFLLKELYGNVECSKDFNSIMYVFYYDRCQSYSFHGYQVVVTNDENFCSNAKETITINVDDFINKLQQLKLNKSESLNKDNTNCSDKHSKAPLPSLPIGSNQTALGNSQLSNIHNRDNREQTNKIVSLLREFNSLENPQSITRIEYFDDTFQKKKIVRTQNSTFILDENSQRVTQSRNPQSYNLGEQIYPTVPNLSTWSYDEFIAQLNKQIADKKSESHSWQSTQASSYYYPQPQPQQAVLQGRSLSTHQPVYHYPASTIQQSLQPQPQQPIIWNNIRSYPFYEAQSALPCAVGGGAMAVVGNHMPSQFSNSLPHMPQQSFTTSRQMLYPQPMQYSQRPGLMVYQPMQVSQPTILYQGQMLGFGSGMSFR